MATNQKPIAGELGGYEVIGEGPVTCWIGKPGILHLPKEIP